MLVWECRFPQLGIQCVKRPDIIESLTKRKELKIDPFLSEYCVLLVHSVLSQKMFIIKSQADICVSHFICS